ncbi:sulfatase-like hydrolase/transferase [Xylophilus sp. ASV27]|uniref:sulfatase-like hydrolase/transferase n=1 Tax=Xylophilus sp. ASV27 TaxID=2795129 RepID=UPI0018EDCCC8|nr:phosphoethanolamine transferase [Xylophilus sp. ASV27]
MPLPADHRSSLLPSRTWLAPALAVALTLLLIALGHEGRRVIQLAALAAPGLAWLFWPVRRKGVHRLRAGLVWCWAMAFAVDGLARAYLLDVYQAAPDSSMVLGAAANTNARESAEYLGMYWRPLLLQCALLLGAGVLLAFCVARGRRSPPGAAAAPRRPRWLRATCVLGCTALALLSAAGYASKPWRRLHPVAYWIDWDAKVDMVRAEWAAQQQARERTLQQAREAAPGVELAGPATVVLVISDSVNRDNMALYGYGRPTTPMLLEQQRQLEDRLLVLRHAWSRDATTLPALRNLFRFGQPDSAQPQHALALARAAGYKVWWITNHDDVGIEQMHARLADVAQFSNRTPGRSSASLDSAVLDDVRVALADAAPRKLVVVHLMGAHPHYNMRFPANANPFDDAVDAVESGMQQQGRPAWLRQMRHDYDAALLYHDAVVASTLQMTRSPASGEGYRAWMYLSDHGQEVAHGTGRAGHSPQTASGYRIPALLWRNTPPQPWTPDLAQRPFRADWAAWTLADLLHVRWSGDQPQHNVLSPSYQWQAPEIPAKVESFLQ